MTTSTKTKLPPVGTSEHRIYIACLSSYNNGILFGQWIDATTDADEMCALRDAILEASPMSDAEEWAVHDYEGIPHSMLGGESMSFDTLAEFMEVLEREPGGLAPEDIVAVWEDWGGSLADLEAFIEDNYCGTYDWFQDYADEYADDCVLTEAPDIVRQYFDYHAFARDLAMDMHVVDVSNGVAVFHA